MCVRAGEMCVWERGGVPTAGHKVVLVDNEEDDLVLTLLDGSVQHVVEEVADVLHSAGVVGDDTARLLEERHAVGLPNGIGEAGLEAGDGLIEGDAVSSRGIVTHDDGAVHEEGLALVACGLVVQHPHGTLGGEARTRGPVVGEVEGGELVKVVDATQRENEGTQLPARDLDGSRLGIGKEAKHDGAEAGVRGEQAGLALLFGEGLVHLLLLLDRGAGNTALALGGAGKGRELFEKVVLCERRGKEGMCQTKTTCEVSTKRERQETEGRYLR